MYDLISERINDSIKVKQSLLKDKELLEIISSAADQIVSCIKTGGKLILCGNGGSASDALPFAGEIVGGYFQKERRSWSAIALNSNVATMTAIANDYSYDDVFARQVEAHANSGDVLIGISTSGNSENVLRAVRAAKLKGAKTITLLGKDGGKISRESDYPIIVHCNTTARVQESHICIIHILCELTESMLT